MQPLFPFGLSALLALTTAVLASAEPPADDSSVDPAAFSSVTEMQLDDAFEKSAGLDNEELLRALGSPTSMDCSNAVTLTELETCVVTAIEKSRSAVPAALAQH
jgi:hypothetical protein